MEQATLRGSKSMLRGRKPRAAAPNRICARPECSTVLSRYNRASMCSVHSRVHYPSVRGIVLDPG
jgi:hypothetical protein